jgi:hypothetical protein
VTDDAHREPTPDAPALADDVPEGATAADEVPGGAPAADVPEGPPAGSAAPASGGAPLVPGSRARMPEYRGTELDAERGPGLGCFWFQVGLLVFFFFLTPLTVKLGWPPIVSAILLFATLGLLLFVGQTSIFLLRIVAAERRGRRRPLASPTPTVGEIEESVDAGDAGAPMPADAPSPPALASSAVPGQDPTPDARPDGDEGVRQ